MLLTVVVGDSILQHQLLLFYSTMKKVQLILAGTVAETVMDMETVQSAKERIDKVSDCKPQ